MTLEAKLRLLEGFERVSEVIRRSPDLESLMTGVMAEVRDIFGCDRAFLVFPCDPTAPSFRVMSEETTAEWPGALARGVGDLPMTEDFAGMFTDVLETEEAIGYDGASTAVPPAIAAGFGVRAQLNLALHPKTGAPWIFGLHHCTSDHRWTGDELILMKGIGSRVGLALNTLLYYRELRDSEAALRQAQKMQAVGTLAGGIAHDFNNLLVAIMGHTQLLATELPPDGEVALHLAGINDAAERAAELTRQLLAFSRSQVLRPRLVDLNTIVTDISSLVTRLIGEDIDVVTELESEPVVVNADPSQLQQVVVNLCTNARDAMPDGGTLTIRTTSRRADAGAQAILSVADTGTGIEADVLDRIFEPFFTTKPVGRGTGLGLATVFGSVVQSGGDVDVESQVGVGTVFNVRLPIVEGDIPPAAPTGDTVIPASTHGAGATILIVEDEPAVAAVTERVLRRDGYHVLRAADGEDALRLLAKNPDSDIQLIITDVVMPRMGGDELGRRLRASGTRIPILFISGYPMGSDLDPRDAFLSKPFVPSQLLAAVSALLGELQP